MKLSTYAKLVQKEFLATELFKSQFVCNISQGIYFRLVGKFPKQAANYWRLNNQIINIISSKIGGKETVWTYLNDIGAPASNEGQRAFRTNMLKEIIAESSALEKTAAEK